MKMKELAQMRSDLINAIVQYDLMRAGKSGYSIYALPHYFGIAEKVVDSALEGVSMRRAINDNFEGELLTFILSNVKTGETQSNPKGVYMTYSAWRAAAKKAGAVRIEGDKDIAQAFDAKGRGVAEWDGAEGYIYKSAVRENPLKPYKGESSRSFVSRCMSEEKASFPEPKQRIAVCLSKSRKRNPLESGANISDDEDINFRASNMG
jgi:hypothetical protein